MFTTISIPALMMWFLLYFYKHNQLCAAALAHKPLPFNMATRRTVTSPESPHSENNPVQSTPCCRQFVTKRWWITSFWAITGSWKWKKYWCDVVSWHVFFSLSAKVEILLSWHFFFIVEQHAMWTNYANTTLTTLTKTVSFLPLSLFIVNFSDVKNANTD